MIQGGGGGGGGGRRVYLLTKVRHRPEFTVCCYNEVQKVQHIATPGYKEKHFELLKYKGNTH